MVDRQGPRGAGGRKYPPYLPATLPCTKSCSEIGLGIGRSTYDKLYVAFAIAVGARNVAVGDLRSSKSRDVIPTRH